VIRPVFHADYDYEIGFERYSMSRVVYAIISTVVLFVTNRRYGCWRSASHAEEVCRWEVEGRHYHCKFRGDAIVIGMDVSSRMVSYVKSDDK